MVSMSKSKSKSIIKSKSKNKSVNTSRLKSIIRIVGYSVEYILQVGAEYIKLIWVPDTFFVNEKIALFHQVKPIKSSTR